METTDSQLDDDAVEKAQDQEEKRYQMDRRESSKVTQPYDAMRNEPHLVNLIVESYLGEKDERGFFHGIGTAYFKGDHVYSGSFVNGLMDGTGLYIWSHGVNMMVILGRTR